MTYYHMPVAPRLDLGRCGQPYVAHPVEVRAQKCPTCQDLLWFDAAEKIAIENWNEPVYLDGFGSSSCGDGYWDTVEAFIEHVIDTWEDFHDGDFRAEDAPPWVWGTVPQKLSFDASAVISNELESQEFYEGAYDQIPDAAIKEMQAYLDKWAETNCPNCFVHTVEKAVLIPVEEWQKAWDEYKDCRIRDSIFPGECDQCGTKRQAWQSAEDTRCPNHAMPEPYSSCDGVLK